MPTYAQLQSESWWNREVITPELDWLGDELCRRTNRPRVAAGTKGDNLHLNGSHRSQEWILKSRFCTNRRYTVQSGLTVEQERRIAGFDFTPGSDTAMIAQSKRLMAALKAGKLDEVREFYGNVDGDRIVDGWDNLRDWATSSDSSHLWHWHLSIDRTKLRDRKLMERIVAIALGDPQPEETDVALEAADINRIAKATVDELLRRQIDRPDGTTTSVQGALGWTLHHAGGTKAAVLDKLVPGQAAILAAVAGDDVQATVRAELERAAAAERQERAAERADLAATLAPALVAAVAEKLPDVTAEQLREPIAAALRQVLVEGVGPADGS